MSSVLAAAPTGAAAVTAMLTAEVAFQSARAELAAAEHERYRNIPSGDAPASSCLTGGGCPVPPETTGGIVGRGHA